MYEISDNGRVKSLSLAFSRWPLRAIRVVLRRANLSLVLRTLTTSPYSSPFLLACRLASLFINRLHSLDIPPDVKNTRGVKFPFSTLSTLSLYSFFFSSSFSLYICWKGLDLFDKQFGCVTLTSKKDLSNEVHTPLADISVYPIVPALSCLCVEGRSHRH